MSKHQSNKQKIMKGVKYLAAALPLAFIGPSVIYFAYGSRGEKSFLLFLILGFIAAIASILFMFRGIQTIMKGLYDE